MTSVMPRGSLPDCWKYSPNPSNLPSDRFRLAEQVQIIRPARLRVRPGHIEPAERVRANHCSSALPVDIQIAYVEVFHGPLDLLLRRGVDCAGQPELGIVG